MGEKKIDIDGEEYISSARAAELVGYTKDYVGQLARDGKIEAQRVGRNWYIKETSISNHKLSVHYTLTKPKKSKKVESDIDEKPINKAIYEEEVIKEEPKTEVIGGAFSPKNKVRKVSDDNVVFEPYVVEKDKHDLFPATMKKDVDVLTKTDIRYVREKPKEAPTQPAQPFQEVHSDGFRSVPVRKPTMAGIVRNERYSERDSYTRPQRENRPISRRVAIDGVANSTSRRERYVQPQQERYYDYYDEEQYDDIQYDTRQRRRRGRREVSKTVPVVGAIVVFTIIVVSYILISSF